MPAAIRGLCQRPPAGPCRHQRLQLREQGVALAQQFGQPQLRILGPALRLERAPVRSQIVRALMQGLISAITGCVP